MSDPSEELKDKLNKLSSLSTESQKIIAEILEDLAKLLLVHQQFMDDISKGVNNG